MSVTKLGFSETWAKLNLLEVCGAQITVEVNAHPFSKTKLTVWVRVPPDEQLLVKEIFSTFKGIVYLRTCYRIIHMQNGYWQRELSWAWLSALSCYFSISSTYTRKQPDVCLRLTVRNQPSGYKCWSFSFIRQQWRMPCQNVDQSGKWGGIDVAFKTNPQ